MVAQVMKEESSLPELFDKKAVWLSNRDVFSFVKTFAGTKYEFGYVPDKGFSRRPNKRSVNINSCSKHFELR